MLAQSGNGFAQEIQETHRLVQNALTHNSDVFALCRKLRANSGVVTSFTVTVYLVT